MPTARITLTLTLSPSNPIRIHRPHTVDKCKFLLVGIHFCVYVKESIGGGRSYVPLYFTTSAQHVLLVLKGWFISSRTPAVLGMLLLGFIQNVCSSKLAFCPSISFVHTYGSSVIAIVWNKSRFIWEIKFPDDRQPVQSIPNLLYAYDDIAFSR